MARNLSLEQQPSLNAQPGVLQQVNSAEVSSPEPPRLNLRPVEEAKQNEESAPAARSPPNPF